MRPRVIPADDLEQVKGQLSKVVVASMRPRVIPADDTATDKADRPGYTASMRPRVIPADDPRDRRRCGGNRAASMRPRVIPADDSYAQAGTITLWQGFNEAAGYPRG